jgi:glucose/arabinose dehydrogenase
VGLALVGVVVAQGPSSSAAAPGTFAAAATTPAVATPAAAATRSPVLGFALRKAGFGHAVAVTNSNDGTRRLFVVDKAGRILVWTPGTSTIGTYLDLRSKVNDGGTEQGMLGLVFYPGFRQVPLLWVTYTRGDGALVVSRFKLTWYGQGSVPSALEQVMLVVPHPTYTNHNAGMLQFGKDWTLFISTGDGGAEGSDPGNAQSGSTLSGKILRVDVRHSCAGHPLYCVPPDNPLAGTKYRGEVWLVGFRNPWRFSVDQTTGALWIGDVGQDRYEEVDVAAMNQKGLNFGWSCKEANAIYNRSRCVAVAYVAPKAVIAHPAAEALIGGVVYRGARYQALMGPRYIFGDYVTGSVWTYAWNGSPVRAGQLPQVTAFGEDWGKEVWAVTLDGGLYQMGAR